MSRPMIVTPRRLYSKMMAEKISARNDCVAMESVEFPGWWTIDAHAQKEPTP